uniref:Uncharacterized protein n=1 Tax=Arundo donax TaxID=35708 RepID=A0A0A9CDX7_ARUDO
MNLSDRINTICIILIHIDAKLCSRLGTSSTSSHLGKKCCVPDNSIVCTQTYLYILDW